MHIEIVLYKVLLESLYDLLDLYLNILVFAQLLDLVPQILWRKTETWTWNKLGGCTDPLRLSFEHYRVNVFLQIIKESSESLDNKWIHVESANKSVRLIFTATEAMRYHQFKIHYYDGRLQHFRWRSCQISIVPRSWRAFRIYVNDYESHSEVGATLCQYLRSSWLTVS